MVSGLPEATSMTTSKAVLACITVSLKRLSAYVGYSFAEITTTDSLSDAGLKSEFYGDLAAELTVVVQQYAHDLGTVIGVSQFKKGKLTVDDLLRLMLTDCGLVQSNDPVLTDAGLHVAVAEAIK